jgi:hypothetical protein
MSDTEDNDTNFEMTNVYSPQKGDNVPLEQPYEKIEVITEKSDIVLGKIILPILKENIWLGSPFYKQKHRALIVYKVISFTFILCFDINIANHYWFTKFLDLKTVLILWILTELVLRYERWHFRYREEIEVIKNYLELHH